MKNLRSNSKSPCLTLSRAPFSSSENKIRAGKKRGIFILFIDETIQKITFNPWVQQGQPLNIFAPADEQFNIRMCAAISKKKFLRYQILKDFKAYKSMLQNFDGAFMCLSPEEDRAKIIIFLDNFPIHRPKIIKEFCDKYQSISFSMLPTVLSSTPFKTCLVYGSPRFLTKSSTIS